jgi:hypothetical protein
MIVDSYFFHVLQIIFRDSVNVHVCARTCVCMREGGGAVSTGWDCGRVVDIHTKLGSMVKTPIQSNIRNNKQPVRLAGG